MTELTSQSHGERIGRLEGIIEQISERARRHNPSPRHLRKQPSPRLPLAHRPSVGYVGYHRRAETIWWLAALLKTLKDIARVQMGLSFRSRIEPEADGTVAVIPDARLD